MLPQTVMARVASVSEVLMTKVLMSKVPRSEAPASGLLLLRCGGAKAGRETCMRAQWAWAARHFSEPEARRQRVTGK